LTDLIDRVTRSYEREKQENIIAVCADDLPLTYEAITAEWLTNVLCAEEPGAQVISYKLDEKDDGTSNRRRIFITYNQAGMDARLPTSVFCKASHALANRITYAFTGVGKIETIFYNKVRPYLDIEIPVPFLANHNDQTFNSIIMLEDLSDQAYFCTEDTAISLEMAEGQMKLLAGIHGRFENNNNINAEVLGLSSWPQFFQACAKNSLEKYCALGFQTAQAQIPPRIFERAAEIWPATLKSVEEHNSLPATLLHGDCHLKQWYVREDTSTPVMGLADWQCCSFGGWARDVSYCIATSLDVEGRRAWERELLQIYLDAYFSAGGTPISFDNAWRLYQRNMLSALAWWTITLTPAPNQPEMQPRGTALKFIARITQAIDDIEALDAF
jgi:Ecdysteroid kinase-like family